MNTRPDGIGIDSDDIAGSIAARQALGPESEQAVIEAFLDRTGEAIDRRVDARVAAHRGGQPQQASTGGSDSPIVLALGSIALGIPVMGITTQFPAVVALVIALVYWCAVGAINVSYSRRR